jgi:hypothetical protein
MKGFLQRLRSMIGIGVEHSSDAAEAVGSRGVLAAVDADDLPRDKGRLVRR